MSLVTDEDAGARIDAEPTKEFFISMLVRDIELIAAVVDLVDNSVDGARRIRESGSLTGLRIAIQTSEDDFSIEDNCGGIPLELARKYAFRFGRDSDDERDTSRGGIGQFGVGMKRTLFKLGGAFHITSRTISDSFELAVDVEEWKEDTDSWDFDLANWQEGENRSLAETGTRISVTELHGGVRDDLSHPGWVTDLCADITQKHRQALQQGLQIQVNGVQLSADPLLLLASATLKPAHRQLVFGTGEDQVVCDLWAGIGEQRTEAAGWYVFCNGRLVLGPDRTNKTGWGTNFGSKVPRFHGQYARFRGVAVFQADRPGLLPWTTTKVGVDLDSPVWRAARQEMSHIARDVTLFLNALDRERDFFDEAEDPDSDVDASDDGHEAVLKLAVQGALAYPYDKAPRAHDFTYPAGNDLPTVPTASIQFKRPTEQITQMKKFFRVSSNREVGERAFDYVFESEGL